MIRSAGGGAVRGSRRPLRGLLTMRLFLNAIKDLPHPEEHGRAITRPCVSTDAGSRCTPRRYSAATVPYTGPRGLSRSAGPLGSGAGRIRGDQDAEMQGGGDEITE